MTKKLILIRHAKSSWDDPEMSDHDRPLNTRGRRAAPLIGRWLADQGICPEQALCSTAARTQETWKLIAEALPGAAEADLLAGLYLADPAQMLHHLRGASADCVAMIAHNPGTARLAWSLAKAPPNHAGFGHYPTGATTVMDFEIADWSELTQAQGIVRQFAVPRDLE